MYSHTCIGLIKKASLEVFTFTFKEIGAGQFKL